MRQTQLAKAHVPERSPDLGHLLRFATEAGCNGMQRGPIRTASALSCEVERNLQARADGRIDIPTEGAVPLAVASNDRRSWRTNRSSLRCARQAASSCTSATAHARLSGRHPERPQVHDRAQDRASARPLVRPRPSGDASPFDRTPCQGADRPRQRHNGDGGFPRVRALRLRHRGELSRRVRVRKRLCRGE